VPGCRGLCGIRHVELGGNLMAVTVLIPTLLRPYAEKKDSAQFNARTVGDALEQLTVRYAELRKHLFADDGRLRSFVNVYVNEEDIRSLEKEKTPLKEGDTISIIPSIAGGSHL
jgi:MoaD family protein